MEAYAIIVLGIIGGLLYLKMSIFKKSFGFFKKQKRKSLRLDNSLIDNLIKQEEKDKEERSRQEYLSKMVSELSSELSTYKQREQDEKIRRIQLIQRCDPRIVNKNIKSKGKVICYEGTSLYEEIIIRKGFMGHSELNVKLTYKFGIGIDWEQLKIVRFAGEHPVLNVPKNCFQLLFLELNNNDSKTESDKHIWIRDFEPEFVNEVLKSAENKTREQITNNRTYFDDAYFNFKSQIKTFVKQLGYLDVVFE